MHLLIEQACKIVVAEDRAQQVNLIDNAIDRIRHDLVILREMSSPSLSLRPTNPMGLVGRGDDLVNN